MKKQEWKPFKETFMDIMENGMEALIKWVDEASEICKKQGLDLNKIGVDDVDSLSGEEKDIIWYATHGVCKNEKVVDKENIA